MRFLLVYPPDHILPTAPYSSLAVLAAAVRAAGHDVVVRDLNAEFFARSMRHDVMGRIRTSVRERQDHLASRRVLTAAERDELHRVQTLLATPDDVFDGVPRALETFASRETFYDPARFRPAFDTARAAYAFVHGCSPSLFREAKPSAPTIDAYFEQSVADPFIEACHEELTPSLLDERPDAVGISVPFDSGVANALKLARMLKADRPSLPVILGGPALGSSGLDLTGDAALYELFDYYVEAEGDLALPALLEVISADGDPTSVPGVACSPDGSSVRHTPAQLVQDLTALPTPDFEHLPLQSYLWPDPVATFVTSRGCYYGKCRFCAGGFRRNFRMRHQERVVEDVATIRERSGIRHFQMWDSLAPPGTLAHLAREVEQRGLDVLWMAETKFEKHFASAETARALYRGGCRYLHFGLESASQRVLDAMDKGNDVARVELILEQLAGAGIQAGVFWFIGFPTETEAEGDATYDYVAKRQDRLTMSAYTGAMRVGTDMIAHDQPDLLGIEVFVNSQGMLDYRYADGTQHYDWTERDHAYNARSDLPLVQSHAQLLYACRHDPDDVLRITARHHVGPMLRHVRPERRSEVVLRHSEHCHATRFDRHPYRDGEAAHYLFHRVSCAVTDLIPETTALWSAIGRGMAVRDLADSLSTTTAEALRLAELATNRGVVRFSDPSGAEALAWRQHKGGPK